MLGIDADDFPVLDLYRPRGALAKGFWHLAQMNSYLGMTTLVAGSPYSARRTGSVNVNIDPCPT